MPKTTINKNGHLVFRKNKIRSTKNATAMPSPTFDFIYTKKTYHGKFGTFIAASLDS